MIPSRKRLALQLELEETWKMMGPKPYQSSYSWVEEDASPWKFRDRWGNAWPESATWTVSTSEDWWAGIWGDIVSEHGFRDSLTFWEKFHNDDARKAREVAIVGTRSANWSGAVIALNSARHEDHARRIGIPDEFLHFHDSDEIATAMKRNLGEWLYKVIRAGDHGQIRNLAELVSGKKKPPEKANMKGTEKYKILSDFATLLVQHFRLPTHSELRESAARSKRGKGNFPALVRELGLEGLPEKMPKRA